jgi:sec-independent protein translocase protein TatC
MILKIPDIDETEAPLLDHLLELRTRLLRCIMVLGVAFAVCLYFASDIFGFLTQPLLHAFPPGQGKLVYTKLYEAFFVEMKVALFAAFFITFPYLANQLWAFVAPGLYAKEKKAFLPFLIATPVLFTSGAALAYYVVMPTAFRWFLGFEGVRGGGIRQEALPAMGDYLSLVMQFILAFGISFLLPVLLMLLNVAGLVTRQQLAQGRRYVIVAVVAVAAVATPPDVVSQLMLAVPMLLLFEGSLVFMRISEKRAAKERAKEEAQAAAATAAEQEAEASSASAAE